MIWEGGGAGGGGVMQFAEFMQEADDETAGLLYFMHMAPLDQSETILWSYFDTYLKNTMSKIMHPPIFAFRGFRIDMDYWQTHTMKDRQYRRLDKRKKHYATLHRQKLSNFYQHVGTLPQLKASNPNTRSSDGMLQLGLSKHTGSHPASGGRGQT
jgi:hypothetical protein